MVELELERMDWLPDGLLNHSTLRLLTDASDVVGIIPKKVGFGKHNEAVFEFIIAQESKAKGVSYDFGHDEWLLIKEVDLTSRPTAEQPIGEVAFDTADQGKVRELKDALDKYRGFAPEEFSSIDEGDLPTRDDHL